MRPPRHAEVLRESGYRGDLESFRKTLAEIKSDLYPNLTDEILCFGKETSARYCARGATGAQWYRWVLPNDAIKKNLKFLGD